ncbi:hypothetical protein J6590_054683 [Homalodisca vitripennis]|nr:hypothetical protein J6590_054683 [Homalodisca vitripennis]
MHQISSYENVPLDLQNAKIFSIPDEQSKLTPFLNIKAKKIELNEVELGHQAGNGTETVFKYVGCFKDFANGTRLMKGFHQDFPDSLTNQLCARLCRKKGFRYAGMQYGKECFCDSNKPKFQHFAKDEECSTRCDGNNNQICGGNWRISMFEIAGRVTAIDPGTYLGCYKDQESPRALKGHMEDFRNNLVPFMCTGLCYSMGFLYAGIQYSKQCFCGDEHPNPNLKVVEAECAKPCSGDATKKCGGDYRNAVYQTGIPDVPVHEKYVGCYNDFNNHIFKAHKTTLDKTNTPRRCLNYCWQLGFKYSGVEYGRECLCGDDKPDSSFLVSGDECSITCSGDQLETCGGNWRLAVYSTDISASVEPLEIDQRIPTDSTTVRTCQLSKTTINGRKVCSGDVIFEEQFSSPLGEKWKHTIKISEAPEELNIENVSAEQFMRFPQTTSFGFKQSSVLKEDQFDVFGKHIAQKLRVLDNEQQIIAQKLINDALFEAELGSLYRNASINTGCSFDCRPSSDSVEQSLQVQAYLQQQQATNFLKYLYDYPNTI